MRSVAGLSCLLALAGACGDKAIELTLQLPPSTQAALYDTSCVRAVRLDLDGANYPANEEDYAQDCVDLEPGNSTFAQVRDALIGRFDVALPASGLSGVELYAHAGSCDAARPQDYDLIFYAGEPYIGQEDLVLKLQPNLSCAPQDATIQPLDLLKLVATKNCATATWTEPGRLGLTTVSPMPFTEESYWWGGQASSTVAGGVAIMRGNTKVAPQSCLAVGLYTDDWNELTCVPPPEQRVCATGDRLEAPLVDLDVGFATADPAKTSMWGSLLIGAVYGTMPVMGATVTLDAEDADKGEVVYFDMPPGVELGTGALTVRGGTSTGASGLFGIYTRSPLHITVTANGKSVKRLVAGNDQTVSTVLVKM